MISIQSEGGPWATPLFYLLFDVLAHHSHYTQSSWRFLHKRLPDFFQHFFQIMYTGVIKNWPLHIFNRFCWPIVCFLLSFSWSCYHLFSIIIAVFFCWFFLFSLFGNLPTSGVFAIEFSANWSLWPWISISCDIGRRKRRSFLIALLFSDFDPCIYLIVFIAWDLLFFSDNQKLAQDNFKCVCVLIIAFIAGAKLECKSQPCC